MVAVMKISVVVPVYNEEESLDALHEELARVLDALEHESEILLVNDGSADDSAEVLSRLAEKDPRVRVLTFARNFGQTAAMAAGIEHATGDVVIPMDADLQNDPNDIPKLLLKLDEGFDVVSGWRKDRQDKMVTRRLPSKIANGIISRSTGVHLHDYGCTLKAYRRSVLENVHLYGEMHRFIPVYAAWRGGKVTEMVVNHRARQFGTSKYGLNRTIKVLLDLATIKMLGSFSTKPNYLFGGVGAISILMGFMCFAGVVLEKLIWNSWQHKMSLLILSSFLVMVGVVLVMMGLLAELIVRTYHESQGRRTYILKSDTADEATLGDRRASRAAPAAAESTAQAER